MNSSWFHRFELLVNKQTTDKTLVLFRCFLLGELLYLIQIRNKVRLVVPIMAWSGSSSQVKPEENIPRNEPYNSNTIIHVEDDQWDAFAHNFKTGMTINDDHTDELLDLLEEPIVEHRCDPKENMPHFPTENSLELEQYVKQTKSNLESNVTNPMKKMKTTHPDVEQKQAHNHFNQTNPVVRSTQFVGYPMLYGSHMCSMPVHVVPGTTNCIDRKRPSQCHMQSSLPGIIQTPVWPSSVYLQSAGIAMRPQVAYVATPVPTVFHTVVQPIQPGRPHIAPSPIDQYSTKSKQKSCNMQKSKFRGVSWHKRDKKWVARTSIDKRILHLGSFRSEILAALVVDLRRLDHYGLKEVASTLNIPRTEERTRLLKHFTASGEIKYIPKNLSRKS